MNVTSDEVALWSYFRRQLPNAIAYAVSDTGAACIFTTHPVFATYGGGPGIWRPSCLGSMVELRKLPTAPDFSGGSSLVICKGFEVLAELQRKAHEDAVASRDAIPHYSTIKAPVVLADELTHVPEQPEFFPEAIVPKYRPTLGSGFVSELMTGVTELFTAIPTGNRARIIEALQSLRATLKVVDPVFDPMYPPIDPCGTVAPVKVDCTLELRTQLAEARNQTLAEACNPALHEVADVRVRVKKVARVKKPANDYPVELLTNCARCGGTHHDLVFQRLANPVGEYTHFAMCPVTNEPILMVVVDVKKPAKKPAKSVKRSVQTTIQWGV